MTGYQEIMTDPSYAGQVVTFTFPHIGNVGVNADDDETAEPVAAGMVVKWDPTEPSNWRATGALEDWLRRARPHRHRRRRYAPADPRDPPAGRAACGAGRMIPTAISIIEALVAAARGFEGLVGKDLAREVTCAQSYRWDETRWAWPEGFGTPRGAGAKGRRHRLRRKAQHPALPRQRRAAT